MSTHHQRALNLFTKKFNNGNYTVSFDDEKDEVGDQLSKIQYTMITSKAKISDAERKVRLLISTFPEAFSFSFYGNNINNQVFAEQGSSISGLPNRRMKWIYVCV